MAQSGELYMHVLRPVGLKHISIPNLSSYHSAVLHTKVCFLLSCPYAVMFHLYVTWDAESTAFQLPKNIRLVKISSTFLNIGY